MSRESTKRSAPAQGRGRPAEDTNRPAPRVGIVILGMHRSGTSALTRVVGLLGAALPRDVLGAHPSNPAGHWEPARLYKLHDRMLAEAGSRWDDWRGFDPSVLGPERLAYYEEQIRSLIVDDFGDAQLLVLKEPRICRMVPLYEEILGSLGIEPRFLLTDRNPLAVIDSLATRDGMTPGFAGLLWLRHELDAERATRGKPRAFLSYEALMSDWRAAIERATEALRVEWPRRLDEAGPEIEAHLSPALRRHAPTFADLAAHGGVAAWVKESYEALQKLARPGRESEEAQATLDRIRGEFEAAAAIFGAATFPELGARGQRADAAARRATEELRKRAAELEAAGQALEQRLAAEKAAQAEIHAAKQALERDLAAEKAESAKAASTVARLASDQEVLQRQVDALYNQLDYVTHSRSWRLTAPMRSALRWLRAFQAPPVTPSGTTTSAHRGGPSAGQVRQDEVLVPSASPAPLECARPSAPVRTSFTLPAGVSEPQELERVRASFDPEFYLAHNPDLADSGMDPFEHYMGHGWREGRDPSPHFCTRYYLERSPDIVRAGLNPFAHWVLHGRREKRPARSFQQRIDLIDHAPTVSAVVPNYNHARFLEQRLDSILAQTYPHVDVLVLDDCSTDDSCDIIERYQDRHPGRIRTLFNDSRSGNVFRQWRKGVDETDGELVWICESDDDCEPDFLAKLVPHFRDRAVSVAFGRIQFIEQNGRPREGLDEYRESAEAGIWNGPLTRPAREWFANGFGVNNLIANVGGCLWRRPALSDAVWREAESYAVLGDWFLHAKVAGGGKIAWEPEAVAYFRQHGANQSVTSFVKPTYYREHERLMLFLRRQWGVPDETVERFHDKVAWQYQHHQLAPQHGPLEGHFDKKALLAERQSRPHILMAFLGFHLGGGEIFPINLANALHDAGHLVSMMAVDMTEVNEGLMDLLSPAIPVYDAAWVAELGADRFLAEAGVSLVHSHMFSVEAFFFEQCRITTPIPYLVTLHGSYDVSEIPPERLMRIALGVRHFVYTADKNLRPFKPLRLSSSMFSKLDNAAPIDPRPFPKTRRELGIADDAIVFTLASRGIRTKGWSVAISAIRRLRDLHPDRKVHLLLCGEGDEADRLAALHPDEPDVTFLGYQSRIHGLFRISDVAILPTRFPGESYPFCIIEALQVGTPVIATRLGEIPSMLAADGAAAAGVLIDADEDSELFTSRLVDAMEIMLSAESRASYAAAAATCGQAYSMDRVVEDYVTLYRRILEESAVD
ncbi:MAG: glycosyltransferase [Thermoanaerobaculia bacterium]